MAWYVEQVVVLVPMLTAVAAPLPAAHGLEVDSRSCRVGGEVGAGVLVHYLGATNNPGATKIEIEFIIK